jgi:shikimate kinase
VIVLVGFMGAGKSTVGRLLGRALDVPFHDVDDVIQRQTGMTVATLFADHGEAHFRDLEQRAVAELVSGPTAVLALGGGAAEQQQVRRALAGQHVIYLHVSHEQALARVGHDPQRPMLRRPDLAELHERRTVAYNEVATVVVATDGRRADDVVAEILASLPPR